MAKRSLRAGGHALAASTTFYLYDLPSGEMKAGWVRSTMIGSLSFAKDNNTLQRRCGTAKDFASRVETER